ncbi:ATP-binding protein [Actinomadura sp. DC4]|uniref:ATP-binding protein n=1 Tax=Actinomadura sp. DC4 TaxID=3055069 RepID=UPI0025B2307B|nr:ATP-binding protein [Actinomadura sp. DC4]MDN3351879.1 ATP-binding protein [Actinomadura sp. DC4]
MSILLATRPDAPVDVFRWGRAFPGCPEQASVVRRFVAILLHGCPIVDDVLLAVDELVVNALRHTRSGQAGGTFAVGVRRGYAEVAVMVTDQGCATEPAPTDADELAESGRGLRTVSLLATSWGWHGNAGGRTVTAVFPTELTGVVRLSGFSPEHE